MTKSYTLATGRYIYFASDFHLGSPNAEASRTRENELVRWLQHIADDAALIVLHGDLFDFWFEYDVVIPKGFERFKATLLALREQSIDIWFFTGNHDMWMFSYFQEEFGIPIYREPLDVVVNATITLQIGHGDGLGPGDRVYKVLKSIFTNRFFQWVYRIHHPSFSFWIAQNWSRLSRDREEEQERRYLKEKEYLFQYCQAEERVKHRDFYVFGHRHLAIDVPVSENSRYINTGEWLEKQTFAKLDSIGKLDLLQWDGGLVKPYVGFTH